MKRLSWALDLNEEFLGNIEAGLWSTSTNTSISACILEEKPSSSNSTASFNFKIVFKYNKILTA